jgi:predicted lipoprotein with Yx(FWY)xxD motif
MTTHPQPKAGISMRHCLIALVAAAVVALAAGPSVHAAGGAATVKTRHGKLGTFLVDGSGRTLYLFEADKGAMSKCDGACASAWPPLTTSGKPTAGAGVVAAKLGTAKRADGTTGVTYDGHPLYTYAGDGAPGQTTGEGLTDYGAPWYALSAAGKSVVG